MTTASQRCLKASCTSARSYYFNERTNPRPQSPTPDYTPRSTIFLTTSEPATGKISNDNYFEARVTLQAAGPPVRDFNVHKLPPPPPLPCSTVSLFPNQQHQARTTPRSRMRRRVPSNSRTSHTRLVLSPGEVIPSHPRQRNPRGPCGMSGCRRQIQDQRDDVATSQSTFTRKCDFSGSRNLRNRFSVRIHQRHGIRLSLHHPLSQSRQDLSAPG